MSKEVLKTLFSTQMNVDITLKVENDVRTIKAHRLILKGASKYFKTLFNSNFKEKNADTVTLSGMNFETLQAILKLIYTEEFGISEKCSWINIVVAADYLLAEPALKVLSQYVENNVNANNAIDLYRVSEKLTEKARTCLETFIRNNITKLDYSKLDHEQLGRILKSKSITANTAFDAIKKWVTVDPPGRSKFVFALFSAIETTSLGGAGGYNYGYPYGNGCADMTVEGIMEKIVPICDCKNSLRFAIALLAKMSKYNGPFVKQFLPSQRY